MRLTSSWIGNNGKPVSTAKGPRYQVRWMLSPGAGRLPVYRKRSDFLTKAAAKAFIERLEKAEYEVDGWRIDADGHPSDEPVGDTTVFLALESYVATRWYSVWKTASRSKNRMRLVELVALTLEPRADREALLFALETQRPDRRRPEPGTAAEWAARYLRDHGLRPEQRSLSEELTAARRWVETRSIPLAGLSVDRVGALRIHFTRASLSQLTARTYWGGTVMPFLTWLVDTEQIGRGPVKGQPKVRRDVEAERPDPRRIPEPVQADLVAGHFAQRHGAKWGTFVRIATWCSLRISEALDLRGTSFIERRGRLYVVVATQQRRVTGVDSDDGETLVRTATKSTRDRRAKTREVPVPKWLEGEIRELLGDRLGRDGSLVFIGKRGAAAPAEAVRRWWREAVDEVLVPVAPNLEGITPHAMRHAGMTYWFAQGVDHKRIQLWGGWASLKVMLDTYRGVLDSLEEVDLAGIDAFEWGGAANASMAIDDANAQVVHLSQWRARRLQDA